MGSIQLVWLKGGIGITLTLLCSTTLALLIGNGALVSLCRLVGGELMSTLLALLLR
jgi:hypothetical protein